MQIEGGEPGKPEGAPRADIFRRDAGSVVDMTSYKELMRYANYSDPYARRRGGGGGGGDVDYGAAICMRGDLADGGAGGAGGCYDTKVTSAKHGFWELTCEAVNGPSSRASSAASDLPPFAWRSKDQNHRGLPERFDFPFVKIAPSKL